MLFGLSACKDKSELNAKTASRQLSADGFINVDNVINRLLVSFTSIDRPTIITDAIIKILIDRNLREAVREPPAGSK